MNTLLLRPFIESTCGTYPPLSLMYLSSYMKSKGMSVELLDYCVNLKAFGDFSRGNKACDALMASVRERTPDIIGMTLFSRELQEIGALCTYLKSELSHTHIVLGGPHPTAMPEETLRQIPECDIAVQGESELALYDLVQALSDEKPLESVRGICFRSRENDGIIHTANAEIIKDLNNLPFPDRDLAGVETTFSAGSSVGHL